jgi:hypothetical protein
VPTDPVPGTMRWGGFFFLSSFLLLFWTIRNVACLGFFTRINELVPTDDQIIQFKISQNSDYQGLDEI